MIFDFFLLEGYDELLIKAKPVVNEDADKRIDLSRLDREFD